jgi:uncharacterized protein YukE
MATAKAIESIANPVRILSGEAHQEKGEMARMVSRIQSFLPMIEEI